MLTPQRIAEIAEEHRSIDIGMSNYKRVLDNAWVMMRDLAQQVADLKEKVEKLSGEDGKTKAEE
jgi:hypothetical protein